MTRKSKVQSKAAVYSVSAVDFSSTEAKQFITKVAPDKIDPENWGCPGHFTKDQHVAFVTLRDEFYKRDDTFKNTVMCFGDEEGVTYALCRWLRARKFNLAETFILIDEATKERAEALKHDFYPDEDAALRAPVTTYSELYPQFYHGHAKNGCPLFISQPGKINYHAIESVTTLDGIINFHWNAMHHDFRKRLVDRKKEMGDDFKKFACVCVLDLDGLSASSVNRHVMNIIKSLSKIDNLCYVETLSKMIIVNAPVFFTAIFKVIKGFLDARTQKKIEIFSSARKASSRLRELIDEEHIPSDYGGKAKSINEILLHQNSGDAGIIRQDVELIHLRTTESLGPYEVASGEQLAVTIHSKSTGGANFSITDSNKDIMYNESVTHNSEHQIGTDAFDLEYPTLLELTTKPLGPGTYMVNIKSKTSRLHSDYHVVCVRILSK